MILSICLFALFPSFGNAQKKPVVVITDCYHPYQDPGDNLDLINGYALPDVDLKAVILDITDAFRKDTADHPTLWNDPRGPREAGIIPILQLDYIFNRRTPYAVGPMRPMAHEGDKMLGLPAYENEGIELLFRVLRASEEKVNILSFGSARVLAVAFNREPELMRNKIERIHLSAGTASEGHVLGTDEGANMIPGGEWNVALDVHAFTSILKSGLPIALYPCAGKDGGFVKDVHNSYYTLQDLSFLSDMEPKLQTYLNYAFDKELRYDFLRAMDKGAPYSEGQKIQFESFHVWESAVWFNATNRVIVKSETGEYKVVKTDNTKPSDKIIDNGLRASLLTEIRPDGRFQFKLSNNKSNIYIYYRENVEENEKAMNAVVPRLFASYTIEDNRY